MTKREYYNATKYFIEEHVLGRNNGYPQNDRTYAMFPSKYELFKFINETKYDELNIIQKRELQKFVNKMQVKEWMSL